MNAITPPTPQNVAALLVGGDNDYHGGNDWWPSTTAEDNVISIGITPVGEDYETKLDEVHFRAVVVEGDQAPIVLPRPAELGISWDDGEDLLALTPDGIRLYPRGMDVWELDSADARELAAQLAEMADARDAAQSNTGDTLIRITADEAVAALTAAAHKVTDGSSPDWGRTLIHGIVAGHGIGAGMRFRWDLHNAIHEVRQASGIAWTQDPSGHELTIYDDQDRPLTRFDVRRPTEDAASDE